MPSLRTELSSFVPYSWETPSYEIAQRYRLEPEKIIRMDLNTSPFRPSKWLTSLSKRLSSLPVNLYPDTTYKALRVALSHYTGKDVDEILVGNGADECLMMTAQAYVGKDSVAMVSSPTYSYFRICVEMMGGKVVRITRKPDFRDDVESLLAKAGDKTRMVFLCSPNNPTGNLVERTDLLKLLKELDAVVVVDEAYYEYAGQTFADLTSSYSNLVVVRTLSKAFSLAGVRVGYALAAEETVRDLNKVRPPNSLSVISLDLAERALRDFPTVKKWVARVVAERERLRNELERDRRVKVFNSRANFLLLKLEGVDASRVHEELMKRGIVLRNLSEVLDGCLRLTVLSRLENDKFLATFKRVLDELHSV
ncbi:MAG: histidinol-phosphate transaminase [Candidatus Caldarchaeum sp.]